MTDPCVDIRDATVLRNGRPALANVSLRVQPGEFVGVIGPNGAGKTTLLMLINGLLHASEGEAAVLGVPLSRRSGWRLRRRIGYVAQVEKIDARLPMTVRETVLLGAAGRLGVLRRPGRIERERTEDALRQTGVLGLAARSIGQTSGGEYQRTAIARVMVQTPDLYLFDEPTASIDPRAQKDILRIIESMHLEGGATALYVTHDLHTLPERCTRLVLLKDGRVWREGPREEMLAPALLEELYDASDDAAPYWASGSGV